jgi:hypothetical protein
MTPQRTPGKWRTGSLRSFNAYTGEPEAFIYRLPPDDSRETADNRICIRPVMSEVDPVDDAEYIVGAVNHHESLRSALRDLVDYYTGTGEDGDPGCLIRAQVVLAQLGFE